VEGDTSILKAGFLVEIRNSCPQHVIQYNSSALKRKQNKKRKNAAEVRNNK